MLVTRQDVRDLRREPKTVGDHLRRRRAERRVLTAAAERGRAPVRLKFRVTDSGQVLTAATDLPAPHIARMLQTRNVLQGNRSTARFEFDPALVEIVRVGSLGPARGPGWLQKPLPSDDPANDLERRLKDMLEESEFRLAVRTLKAQAMARAPRRRSEQAARSSPVTASVATIRAQMRHLAVELARVDSDMR